MLRCRQEVTRHAIKMNEGCLDESRTELSTESPQVCKDKEDMNNHVPKHMQHYKAERVNWVRN